MIIHGLNIIMVGSVLFIKKIRQKSINNFMVVAVNQGFKVLGAGQCLSREIGVAVGLVREGERF